MQDDGLVNLSSGGSGQVEINDSFLESAEYLGDPWLGRDRRPVVADGCGVEKARED